MNLLINLWNDWSTFEKLREGVFLFLMFALVIVAVYYATRERKIVLLSAIAMLLAAVLNLVGIVLSNLVFDIQISEVFRLIPVITSIFLISNIGLLAGFYIAKKHRKDFTLKTLRTEYQSDCVKQTIFLVILAFSIFLFVSVQTQAILAISVLSTLIPVWSTYWISKRILK